MSKEIKKAPTIRFRGFTDDWEQRKLGELITEYKEVVTSNCTLPILTSSKSEGVILQEKHFGHKQNHDITGYNILPRWYCTYRNRSDGVDFTFNINRYCDKGIISKFYPVFCGNKNDTFFISLVLNNSKGVIREIGYTCTGTGQKVLAFSDLQKMKIPTTSFDEQAKIGQYFLSLDQLITLHQRKLDQLKKLKIYFLQNLFPAKGEKVPRIRFKGFTGDWKQSELEELATFSKGIGYSKSDLLDSGKPIILYGRLYTKYETVITNTDTFVDEKDGSVHSLGGEVIVPASGETAEDISIASVVKKSGIIIGGDLNIIHPSNNIDSTFLAISISNGEPHKDMARRAQGKSVVHLHNDDLSKIKLWYPSLEEQRRIGQYFCNIDSLINLNQHKINELQTLKKYMIQNMFI